MTLAVALFWYEDFFRFVPATGRTVCPKGCLSKAISIIELDFPCHNGVDMA